MSVDVRFKHLLIEDSGEDLLVVDAEEMFHLEVFRMVYLNPKNKLEKITARELGNCIDEMYDIYKKTFI